MSENRYADRSVPNIRFDGRVGAGTPGSGQGGMNRFAPHARAKDTRGTLKRLLSFYIAEKWALLVVLLLVFLDCGLTLAGPYYVGKAVNIINEANGMPDLAAVGRIILILAVCYTTVWAGTSVQGWVMAGASQRIVRMLRKTLFAKLQQLPLGFYDTHLHGDIMSRFTNDIDNVSTTISNATIQIMTSGIMVLGSFVMMLVLSPLLTLAAMIVLPLLYFLTKVIASRSRKMFSRQQKALGQLNGIIEETIGGLRIVKAFNQQADMISDFEKRNRELCEASVSAQVWSGFLMPMTNIISNIGVATIACVGGLMAINTMVEIGTIVSFFNYSKIFTRPLNNLASTFNTLQSALAGAERVFEILDEEEEAEDVEKAAHLDNPRGEVDFDKVTFAYSNGKTILEDINFHVNPGETIALVGETGAGKTTIVNLLTRFYDVTKGSIRVDGIDVREYARESIRRAFAVVLQDTCLFTDTVANNISYARPESTREQIIEAAKMANADAFIRRLPKGYDTVISGSADSLSQGQRQLLAIARAILCNAPLLILDEATSSVDTRTELAIQSAMLKLAQGRTTFIIAHRLSTIRDADKIMVVAGGKIVECGTHEQLLEMNGNYAEMYKSQVEV